MEKKDKFLDFKIGLVGSAIYLNEIRNKMYMLAVTNPWMVDDMILSERCSKLNDIDTYNEEDIAQLVTYTKELEETSKMFSLSDLEDELDIVQENLQLQNYYVHNIINYIRDTNNYSLSQEELNFRCLIHFDNDVCIYSATEENRKQIKQLRKERGDKNE